MKLPFPIIALLVLGIIDGLRRFGAWLTDDTDAFTVAVLVVLMGILVALTRGGPRHA